MLLMSYLELSIFYVVRLNLATSGLIPITLGLVLSIGGMCPLILLVGYEKIKRLSHTVLNGSNASSHLF